MGNKNRQKTDSAHIALDRPSGAPGLGWYWLAKNPAERPQTCLTASCSRRFPKPGLLS